MQDYLEVMDLCGYDLDRANDMVQDVPRVLTQEELITVVMVESLID